MVGVREFDERRIVLEKIHQAPATARAAESFGRALARTHGLGAAAFGAGPPRWSGDGYIGRQRLALQPFSRWGEFYARTRLLPYAHAARRVGTLGADALTAVERVCERLLAGECDDGRPPSRIHGDLWGGNLLYGPRGAVLIDPAAHGGHGLTDLAMLELFGTQYLDRVQAGYAESAGLDRRLARADRAAPAAPGAGARGLPRPVLRCARAPDRRHLCLIGGPRERPGAVHARMRGGGQRRRSAVPQTGMSPVAAPAGR